MSFRRLLMRLALLFALLAMSGCHSEGYWFPDPEAAIACKRNENLIRSLKNPLKTAPGDITLHDAEHIASLALHIRDSELRARVAAMADFQETKDVVRGANNLRNECDEANPMKFDEYLWGHFWLIWLSIVLGVAPVFLFFQWIQIHRIQRGLYP